MKSKARCKTCGSMTHYTYQCFATKKKALKQIGKQGEKWISERKYFIEKTRPDCGYWLCHYCDCMLVETKDNFLFIDGQAKYLTVDHIIARSDKPSLRYKLSNLVPCCFPDNILKGSMDYVKFLERYYPHKLDTISKDYA